MLAALDVTASHCHACLVEIPFERLTNTLGLVCRHCDTYNEPGSRHCLACQKPLGGVAAPARLTAPAQPLTAPAPPPAPARPSPTVRARLVVERGRWLLGTAIAVGRDEVQVGRAQGRLLVLDDPCLAPLHASFVFHGGALSVRDEGAAGGVFVRLRGVTVPLRPSALFALGDSLLRFGGPLPPPSPPAPDGTRRLGPACRPADGHARRWLEGGLPGRSYVEVVPFHHHRENRLRRQDPRPRPTLAQAHAELPGSTPTAAPACGRLGSASGTSCASRPEASAPSTKATPSGLGAKVLRSSSARDLRAHEHHGTAPHALHADDGAPVRFRRSLDGPEMKRP